LFILAAAATVAACASTPTPLPANASVGHMPRAWPSPRVATPIAQPQIVAMYFSALSVPRGTTWRAAFVTTTNVASMEVRTNLFAIDVPKVGAGRFAFSLEVYDTPPIFLRKYRLRIIARNAEGELVEEDAPFEIR